MLNAVLPTKSGITPCTVEAKRGYRKDSGMFKAIHVHSAANISMA